MDELNQYLSSIKQEKDEKLIPENIKKDITILGVTGTLTVGEDLSEQLAAQDEIIAELQEAVKNKASGGGETKLNIFVQEEEPETKDGIWVKSTKQDINKLITSNQISSDSLVYTQLRSLSQYGRGGSCVCVGDYIYQCAASYMVKYSIKENKYEILETPPLVILKAYSIENNIYLFGYKAVDGSNKTVIYCFDTITNQYTQLALDLDKYSFGECVVTNIGLEIYIFCVYYSSTRTYTNILKFNTLNNTIEKISNLSCRRDCAITSIGNKIYTFGGFDGKYNARCYDTETMVMTNLTNVPYPTYYGKAVAYETDIYIMGGNESGYEKYVYKYDTITDTYTRMNDLPIDVNSSSNYPCIKDTIIYIQTNANFYSIDLPILNFEPNSIVLLNGNIHQTNLIAPPENVIGNIGTKFGNAYLTDENGVILNDIETYIGDGTQWNKIRGGAE